MLNGLGFSGWIGFPFRAWKGTNTGFDQSIRPGTNNDVPMPIPVPVVTFDPALMAAMARPWPDIVFTRPKVVEAGQKPPDFIPG